MEFNLELFVGTKDYTISTAPTGLLLLEDGTIICKSEYITKGKPDCTIVCSGENYVGGDKWDKKCVALIIQ